MNEIEGDFRQILIILMKLSDSFLSTLCVCCDKFFGFRKCIRPQIVYQQGLFHTHTQKKTTKWSKELIKMVYLLHICL